ncbi:MAG: response regulator [Verrucomicrobia bacterium]|nr:response regulator [Verrucomicrobiota bacterium]
MTIIRFAPLLLCAILSGLDFTLGQEESPVAFTRIQDILEDTNGDRVPDRFNQPVKIKGVISSWPNTLSRRSCFSALHDDTGGIGLFTSDPQILEGRYTVGDLVEVDGVVTQYKGLEIVRISQIKKTGKGPAPEPIDVRARDLWGERYSCRLVRLSGTLRVPSNLAPGAPGLVLRDRSGEIPVVLAEKSFGNTTFLKRLVNGGSVEVVGIAGQLKDEPPFDAGYCLFPRNTGDFGFLPGPPYKAIGYSLAIAILVGGIAYFWTRSREAERHAHEVDALSSQLRKSEQELRQAQKMEAIGRLGGGIAHDFNNILTVVKAHACQLLEANDVPPRFFRPLHAISRSVDRAANLTKQLLLFSRRQAMQPRVLDLRTTIQNMLQMLRPVVRENIRLQVDLGPVPLPIYADESMIEQVLLNLTLNARDAMPDGGVLRIQTEQAPMDKSTGSSTFHEPGRDGFHFVPGFTQQSKDQSQGRSGTRPYRSRARAHGLEAGGTSQEAANSHARLVVQDNGCGIEPAHLQKIFEPFFTTKEVGKGNGLGLAIVYGIVNQHHGRIKVDSRLGEGTTFEIVLPLTSKPLEPVHEQLSAVTGPSAGTILVVEDEAELREVVQAVLETAGYRVLLAGTADEATATLEKSSLTPDLLLTDLIMPGSMNGFKLAESLATRYPAMRVIYTSGYVEGFNSGVELHEGRNFLPKPYPPKRLLNTVRTTLESQPV